MTPSENEKDASAETEIERLHKEVQKYMEIAKNITCEYCGLKRKDAPHIPFHRDHIVPRRWGGSDVPENMADACAPCNYSKRDAINVKTLSGRIGMSYVLKFKNGLWHLPDRGL